MCECLMQNAADFSFIQVSYRFRIRMFVYARHRRSTKNGFRVVRAANE